MLIIVEGPDLAGKTTLVKKLARELSSAQVLHRGPPTQHVLLEYEPDIERYSAKADEHIICDRWHIGELIYGPLMRGSAQLTEPMRRHISMLLASRGAFTVYITPSDIELKRRYLAQGDDFVNLEQLLTVAQAYRHMPYPSQDTYVRRVAPPDPDYVISGATIAEVHAPDRIVDTYVGPANPRYLLLGEKVNHPTETRHTTAFVPYANTSGHFLLSALPVETWLHTGLMNACEVPPALLRQQCMSLGFPRIVTLGVRAHDAAEAAMLPHERVDHPQYVRRFKHRTMLQYGEEIARKLSG